MSQENVEAAVRSFYDAFNRRDFSAIEALLHVDVVVEETSGFNPAAHVYRGRDEALRYFESYFKFWDRLHMEVPRIESVSESVVVVPVRLTVVGRGSDVEVTGDWGHLAEIRDGKVVRATLYRSPEEALEAAGLSE
jgi:ketosteroid isomerase-like protein